MKKALLFITILSMLCITGCSSISKKEYASKFNDVQQELVSLHKEYESKSDELSAVQQELVSVQKELESVQKAYANYKKKIVEEEMSKSGAKAWAEVAFGTEAQAIVNSNDLYVNIPVGYTLSEKSIKDLMNKILSGLSLYAKYYRQNPEQLPYDSVTIIVLEEKTNLDMISVQFLKNPDGTFTQNATMINMNDFIEILPYIGNSLQ